MNDEEILEEEKREGMLLSVSAKRRWFFSIVGLTRIFLFYIWAQTKYIHVYSEGQPRGCFDRKVQIVFRAEFTPVTREGVVRHGS